jgi:hypothetical protein
MNDIKKIKPVLETFENIFTKYMHQMICTIEHKDNKIDMLSKEITCLHIEIDKTILKEHVKIENIKNKIVDHFKISIYELNKILEG